MSPRPGQPAAPRDWCGGDPFQTRLLEAMSLLAPEVERFVIEAVRDALRTLDPADPHAAAGLAFMREEAAHSASHHAFNRRLLAPGDDRARLLRWPRAIAARAGAWLPMRARLCVAAAAEHLSAVVSRAYLDAPARQSIADPAIRALFDRHAVEEIAHRAVVFDLARAVGTNGCVARALALAASVAASLLCLVSVLGALQQRAGGEGGGQGGGPGGGVPAPRRWLGGLQALRAAGWIRPAPALAAVASYLRPAFHPQPAGAR